MASQSNSESHIKESYDYTSSLVNQGQLAYIRAASDNYVFRLT